jgi:hypothetical protein
LAAKPVCQRSGPLPRDFHELEVAIATASEKFIDRFAVILDEDRFAIVSDNRTRTKKSAPI